MPLAAGTGVTSPEPDSHSVGHCTLWAMKKCFRKLACQKQNWRLMCRQLSFRELGPQPVYFSQWSVAQVMPDHSFSVTPVISPVGVSLYVALRRLTRR